MAPSTVSLDALPTASQSPAVGDPELDEAFLFEELARRRAALPYPDDREVLADWNWYFAALNARKLGEYYGRFVAILEKQIIGSGFDPARLEFEMSNRNPTINPDRFVIHFVG